MKNNTVENFNMEILRTYDKKISELENELQNLYFGNLPKEKLEGDLEMPLVANNDSESVILMRIQGDYRSKINRLQKEIEFPERYILRDISEMLNEYGVKKERKEDIIAELTQKEIQKRQEEIGQLEMRIKQVDEEPKWILRYIECSKGDFEAVEDSKVKEELYNMYAEIGSLRRVRKAILDTIKHNDVKEKRNLRKF